MVTISRLPSLTSYSDAAFAVPALSGGGILEGGS